MIPEQTDFNQLFKSKNRSCTIALPWWQSRDIAMKLSIFQKWDEGGTKGFHVQSRFEFKNRDMLFDPDDYQRMIVKLNGCVSLMWIVSEVLGIPREDLDENWDEFDEYPIDFVWNLEDEKIWQCIEQLCDACIDKIVCQSFLSHIGQLQTI